MKLQKSLLLFLALICLASCSAQKQPKDIVEKYLTAIDNFDYDNAKQYVIPNVENLKSLDNIKRFGEKLTESQKQQYKSNKKNYDYTEKDLTNNSATVVARGNQGNYPVIINFKLLKKNRHWLIENFESN